MLRYMVLAGALCAGCAPYLSGGVSRIEADATVIWLVIGVVVAALMGVIGRREVRVVAAVAGVGLAVTVWWLLVRDLLTAVPGDDLPVLAVGSLAVAVGVVGLAARRDRVVGKPSRPQGRTAHAPQPPAEGSAGREERVVESPAEQRAGAGDSPQPHVDGSEERREAVADAPAWWQAGPVGAVIRWRPRPFGVAAVVVVMAAAVLAPTAAEAVVVRSDVREAWDSPPLPPAERLGQRQWTWQPSAKVVNVVAAGHGVAVATTDGFVVGLNGVGGKEEWRYGRPGGLVSALIGSTDGRTVLVVFRLPPEDWRWDLVVALDSDTGAPRFEMVVSKSAIRMDGLTPGSRMLTVRDENGVTGYDLADGEQRWRWELPKDCETSYFARATLGRTTVLVPVECRGTWGVTALDEVTGQQRWRHEVSRNDTNTPEMYGFPGGAVVEWRTRTLRPKPGVETRDLLDAETGRVLASLDRSWSVRADRGVTSLLQKGREDIIRVLDPNTGATTTLPLTACPDSTSEVTTSTVHVRVCDDKGDELTLVTQPLDGSPPSSTQVRLDAWDPSFDHGDLRLVVAPGAIVLARKWSSGMSAPVVGLEG